MRRNRPFTFYEFFAGGGMARLGLGEGWDCLFANDFDPGKAAAYRANFPDAAQHFREGDVWKLRSMDLPGRADLAWASSPCQDFSLAGARAGLKGGRSSAFFGFWQLIKGLAGESRQPKVIVVENVVGLLTSHDGADFRELCAALAQQNYYVGAIEIDAQRFVPQSRPRLFIVATQQAPDNDLTCIEPLPPFHSKQLVKAAENLPPKARAKWIWWKLSYPPPGNKTIDSIVDFGMPDRWLSEEKINNFKSLLNARHSEKLKIAQARREQVVGTAFRRMRVENGKKVQRAELRFDGRAGCLRTPGGGSSKQFVVVVEGAKLRVRPMSTREAASLMGLPATYNLPKTQTASLKLLGDGVVVPVVAFLRENLLDHLLSTQEGEDVGPLKEVAYA